MAKEFDEFRWVLASLREQYQTDFIKVSQIAEKECCDPKTVHRRYGIPGKTNGIDIAVLARRKCLMASMEK